MHFISEINIPIYIVSGEDFVQNADKVTLHYTIHVPEDAAALNLSHTSATHAVTITVFP